ncbi:MAG: DUF3795 domain-containing protein, partial [Promethearchaeota archaeon]
IMSKIDENLITYCGFYCLDCPLYTQKIPNLAEELIKELKYANYQKFAKEPTPLGEGLKHYKEFCEVLETMAKSKCPKGCRNGGGNPRCEIRICCKGKGYEGCWECETFELCETHDALIPVHEDAHIKNLRIIREKGKSDFLKGKRNW